MRAGTSRLPTIAVLAAFAALMLAASDAWSETAAPAPAAVDVPPPSGAAQPDAAAAAAGVVDTASVPAPDQAAAAMAFLQSLTPRTGVVDLPAGGARLSLPETLYFLSAQDARRVLEEAWGNPPDESPLGMLFPAGLTPLDGNAWGVVITYTEDGHVDDGDAADIDYDALLAEMQADVQNANAERTAAGFPAIELVGWAAAPHYDAEGHKLHWARELKFEGSEAHTLNYAVRVLGRKGVLELNVIGGMEQLLAIQQRLPEVLAAASFADGARYADFDPEVDAVAAYGIGALVAGKVAAKLGWLAAGALLLKKFGVLILGGGAAVLSWLRRRRNAKLPA